MPPVTPRHKRGPAPRVASFKFWYLTRSGSGEVMTDIMDEEEAISWLHTNPNHVTAVLIHERMTREEAMRLVRKQVGQGE